MYRRDLCIEYDLDPVPFGRLKPVCHLRRQGQETIWLFECQCGNTTEVSMGKVRPGCTQSCGCLKREKDIARILPLAGRNRLPVTCSGVNLVYRKYQTRARLKGLAFELSRDQFAYLISQPCYIPNCGVVNSNTQRIGKSEEVFKYNGIDRIDSHLGYVDGNVAACCKTCNIAKNDMSLHDFYRWIERLKGTR